MRPLISIIYLLIATSIFADGIEIRLNYVNKPILGVRHIAIPVSYDNECKIAVYAANEGLFGIKACSRGNQITYNILHDGDTVKQISVHRDSVSSWSINQNYESHAVRFKFGQQYFFFIPGTKLQYNDTVYNKFPCMISDGDIKHGRFDRNGSEIYLLRNDTAAPPVICVKENGAFHTKASFNGLNYKSEYALGDTLPLDNRPFVITGMDWENSELSLSPICHKPALKKMGKAYLKRLSPFFNNKEYLFIDFWGTWCTPCIQSFPKLKELYASNKAHVGFLSICYDAPENRIKMEKILNKYKIEWANRLVLLNTADTIVGYLDIDTFPSYALINREGELVFFLSGENNIPKISFLLEELSQ